MLVGNAGYTVGPDSLAAALMAEAGLSPPPGAPAGYGGFVPLEKLIMLRPDYLVTASLIETPDGQGALYLTHPALQRLYPPERRIVLPARYHSVRGPEPCRRVRLSDRRGVAARGARATRLRRPFARRSPTSASSPSVSAAGPGCRISGDLISRSQPVRTAGIASKPVARARPSPARISCRTRSRR